MATMVGLIVFAGDASRRLMCSALDVVRAPARHGLAQRAPPRALLE
jgi:hypothetical protein